MNRIFGRKFDYFKNIEMEIYNLVKVVFLRKYSFDLIFIVFVCIWVGVLSVKFMEVFVFIVVDLEFWGKRYSYRLGF